MLIFPALFLRRNTFQEEGGRLAHGVAPPAARRATGQARRSAEGGALSNISSRSSNWCGIKYAPYEMGSCGEGAAATAAES